MKATPLVSVIIPAYNAHNFIGETLDSVIAQTYQPIEIIVVDDGSTDDTARIVSGYRSQVQYYHQKNSGGCAIPRNTGIAISSGEFLCFIDADDLMVPDRIASQVDFMQRFPEVGLVFSNYQNFTETAPYPTTHFETCPILHAHLSSRDEVVIENARAYLAQENFGIASSFLMRRSLVLAEPSFEPSLKSSEDFHYYYRLSRHTQVGILNKVGMLRRLHGNNMSGKTEQMRSECIRSYIMLQEDESDAKAKTFLTTWISAFWSDLARFNANRGLYLLALRQEAQAFCVDFKPANLLKLFRNTGRILMMASGLHRPGEK